MSINALTNAAIARRPDFEPADRVPQNRAEIAAASGSPPAPVGGEVQGNGLNTALQTLTTYIPTEVLTLYVSAVAALSDGTDAAHPWKRWLPFIAFLAGTPFLVWVAFATKLKTAGKTIPASPKKWPVWEMCAATIAFVAWAFALPATPFAQFTQWYSPSLAGFLVLFVSGILAVVAPLMQSKLSA